MFTFHTIGKEEYDNLNCPCLFEGSAAPTYVKIEHNGQFLKFSHAYVWQFLEIGPDEFAIGSFTEVYIYNWEKRATLFHLDTSTSASCFSEFRRVKNKLLVFSDCDVYLVNLDTYEIEKDFYYPDIYTSYELNDNILKINYLEGGEATIDLNLADATAD